jgi:XRE family transcriptional regulator, regulator of sulfur utilization
MKNPKNHLAQTLKKYRADKGWSLDVAAEKTGVSKAMLGQIERAESSPTVATLWKIVTGFEVSFSSFIEPLPTETQSHIIRTADDIRQHPKNAGFKIAALFPYEPRFGFEYFELTFVAGYERLSEPHETGVVEHMTIIEGSMDVLCDGQWHSLKKGQSLRFGGDQPHGYRNLGSIDCVVLNIIHYPHHP